MPIRVDCPSCSLTFRVDDRFAGKRGRCPACEAAVEVPTEDAETYGLAEAMPKVKAVAVRPSPAKADAPRPASTAAPATPSRTPVEILAGFRGEIAPVRPTLMYRLWIVIVAGIMVLLPLIYVSIVAGVVVGLWLYAANGPGMARGGRVSVIGGVAYAVPLVAGAILVLFLAKPLVARPRRSGKARSIDPSKEPLLFAFVDGVCRSLGAPRPDRIEVNCDIDAGAALDRGELVLIVGLPLVAGLDLKQFSGIVAHELGHFSQRAGMRLWRLIVSINRWFYRVVYERDEWDEALSNWTMEDVDVRILLVSHIVVALIRAAVWLTRRVLWVLMYAGHLASLFLSRQMEFDADRYEARMVGGDVFASTTARLAELSLAHSFAFSELEMHWRERRLPDNLPRLVAAQHARMPAELRAVFAAPGRNRRAGLFDTHPPDSVRIARARRETSAGVFRLDGPAADLFRDFDAIARAATFDEYRTRLGRNVSREQLFPIEEAFAGHEVAEEGGEAFGRVFLGALNLMRPLPLPTEYPAAPRDLRVAKKALVAARTDLELAREEAIGALRRWKEGLERATAVETASTLLKAGARFGADEFGLAAATPEAAEGAAQEVAAAFAEITPSLQAFEAAAVQRLTVALGMLESAEVAARVSEGPARRDEARALYPCAAHLGSRVVGELPKLLRAQRVLHSLWIDRFSAGNHQNNQPLINAVLRAGRELRDRLEEVKWKIDDTVAYPFEHAREDMTLGRFALPGVPHHEALADLLGASDEAISRLLDVHGRALGRLAVTVEEVERVLGLKPIVIEGG